MDDKSDDIFMINSGSCNTEEKQMNDLQHIELNHDESRVLFVAFFYVLKFSLYQIYIESKWYLFYMHNVYI